MPPKAEFLPLDVDNLEPFEVETEQQTKTDAEQKTDAIVDALQSDPESFVNISRQLAGGNNSMAFVARIPADKFDIGEIYHYLQSNYGGGDYRLMVYSKGKLKANRLISIAEKVKTASDISTEGGSNESIMKAMLNQMQSMQSQIVELANEKNSGSNSRKDMLEEMMLYKNLFASESNSSGGNPMSQLKELFEVQSMFQSNMLPAPEKGDEDAGFMNLLEKATPLFTAAMTQPAPTPEPAQTVKPNPQQRKAQQMNFAMKMALGKLKKAALKKRDPASFAESILDMAPSEQMVEQFILQPTSIQMITKHEPILKDHIIWLTELVEHIKAQLGHPSTVSHLYNDEDEALTSEENNTILGESEQIKPNDDGSS